MDDYWQYSLTHNHHILFRSKLPTISCQLTIEFPQMFLKPLNVDNVNVHPCCCTVSAYLCIKPLFRMSDELPWALFVIQIWMDQGKIGWFRTRYKYHWHDASLHCHCRSSRWKKCLFCSVLIVYLKVFGACLKKLFINALISMAN